MSHVLYRKYRPHVFDEVVGQKIVVDALKTQLNTGAISHAYLFFGSRGTGKTSIARIFGTTLGISQADIYEIDAASNRGIDDVRELRQAVRVGPLESSHKLYIIDEVHMLTKEAFNALLKTLEEPPAHVIFILATTEIEKVPETIISRCQVYTFDLPTVTTLKEHMHTITEKEGFTLSGEIIELVAISGDGSFRDALGSLQKVLGSENPQKLTIEEVENMLHIPSRATVYKFVQAFFDNDKDTIFSITHNIAHSNIQVPLFIKQVLDLLREILLARFISTRNTNTHNDEKLQFIQKILETKSTLIQSKTLQRFLPVYNESKNSAIPILPLELAVLDILEHGK